MSRVRQYHHIPTETPEWLIEARRRAGSVPYPHFVQTPTCQHCGGKGHYFVMPEGMNPFLMGAIAASKAAIQKTCSHCHGTGMRRPIGGPDFECEDCIGMRNAGCYCAAMGATKPGGPAKE